VSAVAGPLVVIGVGNVLLGDDGVGVRVVEALRREAGADPEALPPDTRLVDGGTLGLDLLRDLDGARGLLVVDAADLGALAGTVTVRRDERAGRGPAGIPAGGDGHGVAELLAVAGLLGILPAAVSVIGIGLGEIGVGPALSSRVAAAGPRAVAAARRELGSLDARAAASGAARTAQPGELAGATA
jgi:hydrogenase maturation protease